MADNWERRHIILVYAYIKTYTNFCNVLFICSVNGVHVEAACNSDACEGSSVSSCYADGLRITIWTTLELNL